jgi:adiponectin receptor
MVEEAKTITENIEQRFKKYVNKFNLDDYSMPHFMRMSALTSISDRVSSVFGEIKEDYKESKLPDITFSSYFEYPGEILNEVSKIPLYIHVFSAIMWLMWSAIFHLFYVHSPTVSIVLAKLDYAGISFLVGGSSVSPVYYMLYCNDGYYLRPLYLTIIAVGWLSAFTVSMASHFDTPAGRKFKAILFVILGVASAFPLIQFWFFRNTITMFEYPSFKWVLGGGIYIFGAFVYSIRIPECFFPGKFDFFGHSHNLWHFFVLLAAVVHFYGSLELYHLRRHFQCPV